MYVFAKLPFDIINNVLSFDERFRIHQGIPINIIPKYDFRYTLLKRICRFCKHYDYKDEFCKKTIQRNVFGKEREEDSRLQDNIYVIILEKKMKVSIYIQHYRYIEGKRRYIYYSYDIHNYGQRCPSERLKKRFTPLKCA